MIEHLVNLFIDRSLVLRGGYANCEDAENGITDGSKSKQGGSGVHLSGSYIDLNLYDSLILSNQASFNDDGLYCDHADVRLRGKSGISGNFADSNNVAYGNGGGY